MRRVRQQEGQLFLSLQIEVAPRNPSVTFHKSGRFVLLKPNDVKSLEVMNELLERQLVQCMRRTGFYGSVGNREFEEKGRLEIFRWLETGIENHPIVEILQQYGIEIEISPTLKNYMAKELRRQKLEATPYPVPPITTDISLFDRCCEGLILKCTKDFTPPNGDSPLFRKGSRYMVLSTGGEGRDVVVLSTHAVSSHAVLDLAGAGARHEWTLFDQDMEGWFDDSESIENKPDMLAVYPKQVEAMSKKLKAMNLPLYEHVEVDAAMMALKRGVLNGYPMRMAKTSCAIAVAELAESEKMAVISPGNARLFWSKEFKRLGFTQGEDFAEVRSFKDLETTARYKLFSWNWVRQKEDSGAKIRAAWADLLKPSERVIRRKKEGTLKTFEDVRIELKNPCPHCKVFMERYAWSEPLQQFRWTTARGYMCRNKECVWTTDNRKKKGTAWKSKTLIHHKGGYIDFELAAHVRSCLDEKVKGRMCPSCHVVDSEWIPPRYKRLKKAYTHVILDEGHACKDHNSDTAQAGLNFRARRRQVLSGTFISNSPMDIYWPLHWAQNAPNIQFPYFRTEGSREFDHRFCDQVYLERPVGTETDAEGNEVEVTKTVRKRIPFLKNPPDFWQFTAPQLRRRTYHDPLFQKTLIEAGRFMPKVDPIKVPIPMHPIQAQMMLDSIKDFKAAFEAMQKEAEAKNQMLNMARVQNMSQMVTMRSLATCPERMNEKFGTEVYKGPKGGGKMRQIDRIVREEVAKGGKVLILSDFITMQRSVEEQLKDVGVIRFNTQWNDDKRLEAFEAFQLEPDKKVFVAGTRAVRESVDLSAADAVICTDLLWSPAFQMQAWSRALAPQTRDRICKIYMLLSQNSIDEHIYNVFYSKAVAAEQALDRKVMNRRAQEVDVKWFVDRILEAEQSLSIYLRDGGYDTVVHQKLNIGYYEDREA
jgi:hypothetical protein